jgi:hypothetical protein
LLLLQDRYCLAEVFSYYCYSAFSFCVRLAEKIKDKKVTPIHEKRVLSTRFHSK